MKLSTILVVCLTFQMSHQRNEINYRFLNLTKTISETSTKSSLHLGDEYYYYDDSVSPANDSYLSDYYDTNSYGSMQATTTTTGTTTTTEATTMYDNYEYYDDYDTDDYDYSDYSTQDPYTCPLKCRCVFRKISKEQARRRRESADEYIYDYIDYDKDKDMYDIEVDCSRVGLSNILKLFDEEFPLKEIISL